MIDPIIFAIGRILSAEDKRMLPKRKNLECEGGNDYPGGEDVFERKGTIIYLEEADQVDLSCNGFCEAVTIQAIDQKYHGGE